MRARVEREAVLDVIPVLSVREGELIVNERNRMKATTRNEKHEKEIILVFITSFQLKIREKRTFRE